MLQLRNLVGGKMSVVTDVERDVVVHWSRESIIAKAYESVLTLPQWGPFPDSKSSMNEQSG